MALVLGVALLGAWFTTANARTTTKRLTKVFVLRAGATKTYKVRYPKGGRERGKVKILQPTATSHVNLSKVKILSRGQCDFFHFCVKVHNGASSRVRIRVTTSANVFHCKPHKKC